MGYERSATQESGNLCRGTTSVTRPAATLRRTSELLLQRLSRTFECNLRFRPSALRACGSALRECRDLDLPGLRRLPRVRLVQYLDIESTNAEPESG